MIKVLISFEDLDEYIKFLRNNPEAKLSLNEFTKTRYNLSQEVITDLSKVIWKHRIDLSNANLSNTILDGLEFSGNQVVIKGADIRGASLNNVKFTNHISLAGTKIGSIALNKKIFVSCQLKDAEYIPYASKILMVEVTDEQLRNFLSLSPSKNINTYMSQLIDKKGYKVIASLKGRVINNSFSNKDLSGANLEQAIITGEIDNLSLRDCITNKTIFNEVHLKNLDIRGTALVDSDVYGQGFQAAIFEGQVIFDNSKTSFSTDNINLLEDKQLIPLQNNSTFNLNNIILDPCYIKGSNNPNISLSITCTRKDFIEYAEYCLSVDPKDIKDFNEWKELPEGSIADFAEADLSNIQGDGLSKSIFSNCNFSIANFSGTKLDGVRFNNCNLTGVSFGRKTFTKSASLTGSYFTDCDLSSSNLDNVNASGSQFIRATGLNIKAVNLNITGANAPEINFSGANIPWVQAQHLEANDSNWSYSYCEEGNFSDANMERSDFAEANFSGSSFSRAILFCANLFKTNLASSDLTKVKLNQARIQANIDKAKCMNTILDDADLQGLFGSPTIENVDFMTALSSSEQYKYAKDQAKQKTKQNEKDIYNKYALRIALCAVAISIVAPPLILAFAPTALSSITISIIAPILYTASSMVVAVIGVDKATDRFFGYDLGIVKSMADTLGAKKVINKVNAGLEKQITHYSQSYAEMINHINKVPSIERQIIAESTARHKNVKTKTNVEKFQERNSKKNSIENILGA